MWNPGGHFGLEAEAGFFGIEENNLNGILIHSLIATVPQVCIVEASSLFVYQVIYTLQGTIPSN